jgi:hypothetical protein
MSKYFYEKSEWFYDDKINLTYRDILEMRYDDFEKWILLFRKTALNQWDSTGAPPVIGIDECDIISNFSKLQGHRTHEVLIHDDSGDEVVFNFNKYANSVNQFFPAMYKTKIGGSSYDKPKPSIYDIFSEDEYLPLFIKQMRRLTRQDGMYRFSNTIEIDNPQFHNSNIHDGVEWVNRWVSGDCVDGFDFCISQANSTLPSPKLTASDVKKLYEDGTLQYRHISSIKGANWGEDLDSLVDDDKFPLQICIYDVNQRIFPKATVAFRLGMGSQPAVNFPPLTAKYLYTRFTEHIKSQDIINVYDPSAGWGGRILGALSVADRNIHYIGNDPNTENYIDELGITRYEYLAEFFQSKIPGVSNKFWGHANTYEIFRTGSEIISDDPNFKKYKGKLDFAFTSPPYFDRERYSDDDSQSFKKFNSYDLWRDNFLKPTLTTIYEYLRHDRYMCWNIADIRVGSNKYFELEQDSIDILSNLGMEYQGKIKMALTTMVGMDASKIKNNMSIGGKFYKYEPIFIFYKP